MNYSSNFNLRKPERNEQFNLDDWNSNTDSIDTAMQTNKANIATQTSNITTLVNNLTSNENKADTTSTFYKLFKLIYPVGSLYWSSKSANPADLFGGTWAQIKDKFVLACGDTYKTTGATGGASSVTLTVSNMPSHSHSFTPSGTISMNAHSHTIGSHSHTFSGTTSADGLHYHFVNAWDTFASDTYSNGVISNKLNATIGRKPTSPNFTHNSVNTYDYIKSGEVTIYYPNYYYNNDNKHLSASDWIDCEGNGTTASHSYTHYNQKYTSYSGGHTHTYSGMTSYSTPSCSSVTTSGSFSGTAGTTGSNGSGTSFSILPPYIVKYCWERTA